MPKFRELDAATKAKIIKARSEGLSQSELFSRFGLNHNSLKKVLDEAKAELLPG